MLMDLLTSPTFGAIADLIQVGTFLGVFWTVWVMYRDRQPIAIWVRSKDGREQKVGTIARRFLTRGEIAGWISMKAGPERIDFRKFDPDCKIRKRKIFVDLTAEDFERLQGGSVA